MPIFTPIRTQTIPAPCDSKNRRFTSGLPPFFRYVRHSAHFTSDRFLGGSFQSLPVDQSEARLCEARCLGLLDDMNDWAGAKFMLAEGDTYMKYPDDET